MKKLGFTLAEIMVALTIVGIIAAVAGPAVTNIAPDKNKVIYLDYYNKLGDTIQKALADQELYNRQMTTDSSNSELFEAGNCIELGCTNATTKSGYPNYQGTSKLTRIIARDWGLKDPGSSTTLNLEDNNKLIFTPNAGNNGGASTLSYSVELQIPNGGKACIY